VPQLTAEGFTNQEIADKLFTHERKTRGQLNGERRARETERKQPRLF
jgi:hypothetical protein